MGAASVLRIQEDAIAKKVRQVSHNSSRFLRNIEVQMNLKVELYLLHVAMLYLISSSTYCKDL